MPWRARRLKMWRIMGVSTTGAIGLGISPVSGKSLVPLPAASTIALIGGYSSLASSRAARSPYINYILFGACGNFTTTLPYSQARRTLKALHGLEDGGSH